MRFLLDENLSHTIIDAVHRYDSALDFIAVGLPGAPPLGTSDPDILRYCEREQRLLIMNNRASMPGHIADLLADGRHHWGVFRTHTQTPLLVLSPNSSITYWGASKAEEHIDVEDWIP